MKRLVFGSALVVALLIAVSSAVASALTPETARREAKLAAIEFSIRHQLDESNVGRCRRTSAKAINCAAIAKGETSAAIKTCEINVMVRAVEHQFYTDVSAAITRHSCTTVAKERLTSSAAAKAIQAKADSFAGAKTELSSLTRLDDLTYLASARWIRPSAHPSEFSTTESCSVSLTARLAAGQVSVETEGFACF
ncbi:MAG: hypothetical protein BGO11_19125 [Solirubrobacterales bacterium 70-9]|nr:MAG: hypothetical protein BGO11_19125 [Solirubrobacterales bacterium 70-9]